MRKVLLIFFLLTAMVLQVSAMEADPPKVPESGEKYMPEDTQTFGEGLWEVICAASEQLFPELTKSAELCFKIFAIVILTSIIDIFHGPDPKLSHLCATVLIGIILLEPSSAFVKLGAQTVRDMTEYGKLLLPVLASALAAQGGASTSAAIYAASSFLSSLMSSSITSFILPLLYSYFCLCIVDSATQLSLICDIKNFLKWLVSWTLKIVLYVFTAYISITGVISGTADASAVKVVKLTISGMVPVVGSILSDASETILVSAGVMKNTAGIYGILATIAVFVGPMLEIGVQYLMLKATAYLCAVFTSGAQSKLLKDFSSGLGLVLAMTGTVCLLILISTVCFMKGVS